MTAFASSRSHGFLATALHRPKEPHPLRYFSQKTSFWIATLSMFAFVIGNMMGQHGWHAFWASVLGNTDDSLIVYTGTVAPIAQIPDYQKWSTYGGVPEAHTFRQVPKDALRDLPAYNAQDLLGKDNTRGVYSVGYMGSYDTGEEGSGSHPGADIRVPEGTPVVAIANGVVDRVSESGGGFGKVIVVRHPNVPDPANPKQTTTLFSAYAHLSGIFISEGMVVTKGEQIGLSGQTGDASGPHLHFQIDRDTAPWHPYWPFTDTEARSSGMNLSQAIDAGLGSERGYENTINPMLYVQANYKPVAPTIAQNERTPVRGTTVADRREARLQERMRRQGATRVLEALKLSAPEAHAPITTPAVVVEQVVAAHNETQTVATKPESVATVEFLHDGEFQGRQEEKLRVRLLDANGATIADPKLHGPLVPRTAYGDAEFTPASLTAADFSQGEAIITVLPRGQRTLVFQLMPFQSVSTPMRFEK